METDRRHIRRKIQKLREELEPVRRVRATQRTRREKNEVPVVAIVGYTNAGKSTLLRSVNRMHQITSGTLTVNGTDVSTLSGKSLRRFRRGIGGVGKWNIYTSLSEWIYFEWIWLQNTADCRCKYES